VWPRAEWGSRPGYQQVRSESTMTAWVSYFMDGISSSSDTCWRAQAKQPRFYVHRSKYLCYCLRRNARHSSKGIRGRTGVERSSRSHSGANRGQLGCRRSRSDESVDHSGALKGGEKHELRSRVHLAFLALVALRSVTVPGGTRLPHVMFLLIRR
jgi:hypothetical protein